MVVSEQMTEQSQGWGYSIGQLSQTHSFNNLPIWSSALIFTNFPSFCPAGLVMSNLSKKKKKSSLSCITRFIYDNIIIFHLRLNAYSGREWKNSLITLYPWLALLFFYPVIRIHGVLKLTCTQAQIHIKSHEHRAYSLCM